MIYLVVIILLLFILWLSYEIRRAPFMDENGNIIEKKKK